MKIDEIKNQVIWTSFLSENDTKSFLQSWEWGALQEHLGYRVRRLGIYEERELLGIAQVIEIKSKRGHFLFVPHGPVIKQQMTNNEAQIKLIISELIHYLASAAKNHHCSFVRIAPVLEDSQENRKIFSDLGFRKSPIYMHAERVWILDLGKSEEQLLLEMRKTTRYSIRRAKREGVVIEKRTDTEATDDFYRVYKKTALREQFVPFSKKFIREEFESFHRYGDALFLIGSVPSAQTTIGGVAGTLAASLLIFTKSSAFYHQGASIHSRIPVPYLMQWEAIREAKRRGCNYYNFWGILQPGRSPKNWGGLTMFKQGFGGYQIDYVPTQDYILSPKYYLTYLYELYLRWRRGV